MLSASLPTATRTLRTTLPPQRRTLSQLTTGFAEIAAWKATTAARRLANPPPNLPDPRVSSPITKSSVWNISHGGPSDAPPSPPTTMLHSAIAGGGTPSPNYQQPSSPPLPSPTTPQNDNERSPAEITDVPSLAVLGKLHVVARTPDSGVKTDVMVAEPPTTPKGVAVLHKLGEVLSLSRWQRSGGESGTAMSARDDDADSGDKTTEEAPGQEKKEPEAKFPRELPMFLGGGLF